MRVYFIRIFHPRIVRNGRGYDSRMIPLHIAVRGEYPLVLRTNFVVATLVLARLPDLLKVVEYTLFFYKKPRDPFSPQSFLKNWSIEPSKFLMGFLIPNLALQGNNGQNHQLLYRAIGHLPW